MVTVKFRQRHCERWRKQLEKLEDGFDFDFEATRLIEKALLDDDSNVLPITGKDVIDAIGVEPGPIVATLLQEALRRFLAEPCSNEELLAHLGVFHESM